MAEFTHFNKHGEARMVDVGGKDATSRRAVAEGRILMSRDTLAGIAGATHRKGDVLGVARVAAIMAAKNTSDLVPLCHPLPLSAITVDFESVAEPPSVACRARVETHAKTGVEMEALAAVQIALLTIYDMCKSADRGMTISDVRLMEKAGGRSGHWRREKPASPAAAGEETPNKG